MSDARDDETRAMLAELLDHTRRREGEQLSRIEAGVRDATEQGRRTAEKVDVLVTDVAAMKRRLDGDGDGHTGFAARLAELERKNQHAMTATTARATIIVGVVTMLGAILAAIIATRAAAPPEPRPAAQPTWRAPP